MSRSLLVDDKYCLRVATRQRSGSSFSCSVVNCFGGLATLATLATLEVLVRPYRTSLTPCSSNKIPGTFISCSSEHLQAKARAMRVISFQDSHFNDRSADDPKHDTTLSMYPHIWELEVSSGKPLSLASLSEDAVQPIHYYSVEKWMK